MELIKITIDLLLQLNYVAVLVATIVMFVVGFLWYGPIFGRLWMKYMGINPEEAKNISQKEMIPAYVVNFVGNFVEVTFLLFFTFLAATQFWHMALMLWIGFMLFNEMGAVFWMKKPWGFFFINSGYRLVSLLIAGFVLGLFF
ncbi:MAG: hypothetical protein COU08_01975 [Candidatus Harrisonbacteria bacterium CG10_big_fil_rev_8_21_14_0_10_42_17]|uniref:DUF1761 domain-containing protein n=1 Tax=Candidatus Harrisonbacteria bacterium CG10_big_fil_rev_8_21_14_0_10_42_17 TaxID=1974584 RepID=A0A2M6WIA9_9BACT|nr:MAG: hypothetical protein COU08_01975 [Candidatus Harrisonbacteria bacterium CG10_big_fil_rev_8_21_14_0_10_42_17]